MKITKAILPAAAIVLAAGLAACGTTIAPAAAPKATITVTSSPTPTPTVTKTVVQAPARVVYVPAAAPAGPFTLPPLPYAYDALEPYFDAETMHLHHDKHHQSYVDKLNAAVEGHPDLSSRTVYDLVANLDAMPMAQLAAIRNQGGGHANHSFLWETLGKGGAAPSGELA